MGKTMVSILAAVTAVSIGATSAFVAGYRSGQNYACQKNEDSRGNSGAVCAYVDADGDGLCDTCGAACPYVDADGDGLCDTCGAACPHVDGNGLCDA